MNNTVAAEHVWEQILRLNPDNIDSLCNLGYLYVMRKDYKKAEPCLQKGLALAPQHAGLLHNMAILCNARHQAVQAIHYFERLLASQPANSEAWFNLGLIYQDEQNIAQAFTCYQRVLELDPTHLSANCKLIFSQYHLSPFSLQQAFENTRVFGRNCRQQIPCMQEGVVEKDPDKTLRIGWVSGDLRKHVVSYFLLPVLEHLHHHNIENVAYSSFTANDEFTARAKQYCQQWHEVAGLSEDSLAQQVRADKIDILVDLSGFTAFNRILTFARKPAPVQVAWLGFFGSTGLDTMDYVLADSTCVPVDEERWFTETVYRLPHSRLLLFKPAWQSLSPLPALKGQQFTFGTFQNGIKINAEVLAVWAEILKACTGAKLRVQSHSFDVAAMKARFEARLLAAGFSASQFELCATTSLQGYYRAYREIDLILDTFPYPGGTTTNDALWQGVPTLTYSQPGMLHRQGEQLLKAAGLPGWVCTTLEEYKQKAIYFGNGNEQVLASLAQVRHELPVMMRKAPAADPVRFASDLAAAFRDIWTQFCAGSMQTGKAASTSGKSAKVKPVTVKPGTKKSVPRKSGNRKSGKQ